MSAYTFRQYRLNEDGPLHGGAFRDEAIRVGGYVSRKASAGIELELEVGTLLWREVVFFDGVGGHLGEEETDSPLYVRLGLNASF